MNKSLAQDGSISANKVPEATALFWIIKMMSTTVGETAADYLNVNLHFGLTGTSIFIGSLLAIVLFLQVRSARYIPSLYWISVVLISVFGTLVTDNLSDNFDVPLGITTAAFSLALIATFVEWYSKEKTLSITAINSFRRECFYWLAILFTFALGTAAGDLVAEGLSIGYASAALLFGGCIAITALAYYVLKINAITCFWISYILTRPLGASCGDLLSQPTSAGGFGIGAVTTSALFLVTIVGLVFYLSITQKRIKIS
ncbi:hypothetical protein PQR63_23425 [Herbaspirillum rhizosphaerae]|uniref:Membrane-anchored protein n=1 Tax=Herbaspirillum rhizosphaerae TaxID=346179 RepID=A0ABW8ZGD0_9BURK